MKGIAAWIGVTFEELAANEGEAMSLGRSQADPTHQEHRVDFAGQSYLSC